MEANPEHIMKNIHAMHINDSMFERGSKRDRHENIGDGFIGNAGCTGNVSNPLCCAV